MMRRVAYTKLKAFDVIRCTPVLVGFLAKVYGGEMQ